MKEIVDALEEDLVLGETLAVRKTGMEIHAQNINENKGNGMV